MGCCLTKVPADTTPLHKELDPLTQHIPDDPVVTQIQHAGSTEANSPAKDKKTELFNEPVIQANLSPEQITKYLEIALEKYLPNYEFHPITRLTEKNVGLADDKFIMEVSKDNQISLNPDLSGTKLLYGLLPPMYVLHAGIKSPNSIKFLYEWNVNGQILITSPFFLTTTQEGSTIPCALPQNITHALKLSDPIPGIIYHLQQLNSVGITTPGSNHNLNGPDFKWSFRGSLNSFNVQTSSGLYWEDVNGINGEVKFTNNQAIKLIVKLVSIT